MNFQLCRLTAIFVAVLTFAHPSIAATFRTVGPFNVTFYGMGESAVGFTGQQDWTGEQMDDIAAALSSWDGLIENVPGRQLVVPVFWQELTSGQGWAFSTFGATSGQNFSRTWPEIVWRDGSSSTSILNNPSFGYDIRLRFDITPSDSIGTFGWNFGSDLPASDEWDLRTIALHELGHTISFTGPALQNDTWQFPPTTFDRLLVDQNGNRPQYLTSGTPGNFDQTGPTFWTGSNANALWGGPVPVRNSGHHTDLTIFDSIMSVPQDDGYSWNGSVIRQPTALDRAFFKDLGWNVTQVPEPHSLALVFACVVSTSWMVRRRRADI